MGNGAIVQERENECALCETQMTKSYFLRRQVEHPDFPNIPICGDMVEVCPECHHIFTYGDKDAIENYKKRRNIIL